jgi:hypothetical protein
LSRFIPSAFDFDVVTDDTGSRGPRRHRVAPPPLGGPGGSAGFDAGAGGEPGAETPESDEPPILSQALEKN